MHLHIYFLFIGLLQQIQKRYSLAIFEPANNWEGSTFDLAFKGGVMVEDN